MIIKIICPICKKEFNAQKSAHRKYCSNKCYSKINNGNQYAKGNVPNKTSYIRNDPRMMGKNHPRWRGGHPDYRGNDWEKIKNNILEIEKDCRVCGSKHQLCVHHIVPYRFSKDNSINNLIVLCNSCHGAIENLMSKDLNELFEKWS